jgi:CBS domain containing-hemolysin-like protein
LFVPESMGVLDLLARMRAERVHLAIVVDEFGGTEGLVTIEDVVEEDIDTLGGLATMLAGHVPQQGEIVEHPSGWRLEVTDSDTRRVSRLRLHAPEETALLE